MKYKAVIRAAAALVTIVSGIAVWNIWFSPTRIAFVNYQVITLGQISKANDNSRIRLSSVDVADMDGIGRYDMVLMNGMGLRMTAQQREVLRKAADKGLPVITTMATDPANEIVSADSAVTAAVKGYLNGGGRRNYRNMLTYIRRHVDGKTFGTAEPDAPVMRELKQFYHIDPAHPEDDAAEFADVSGYEDFLRKNALWKDGAPRIIVTGQMGEPEELAAELERTGNMVYCVRDMRAAVTGGQADSIRPSAVINMAHGRMGDYMVEYLKSRNIPLFAPLDVNRPVDEWEADRTGMNGGFMSQSIVMPEMDGAVRPYVLFGHRTDDEGLQQVFAIPGRLETFVRTVNNHIALQTRPDSEKKVAIFYYKGPGQNALTAAGMEVAPSLYNLLLRMKAEGYRVENMPSSVTELEKLIQRQGAVFNAYAGGARAGFLENGNPELITAEEYKSWTDAAIRPERMAEVVALDGEFPGSYISTPDGKLALPRVELGNVVLLPQLAAGAGDDDFAIVHGTDAAPPHAYIASYLWTRFGFGADVIVHFGTHGSLEFTPGKQTAPCSGDWADALTGDIPHLYVYSIGDVGEGVIAKRRAYATLQSHLTPPFMESNVRGIYKELVNAVRQYNDLLFADGRPDTEKAALKVKRLAVELGIHRELRLDSLLSVPYSEAEISRIESFAEELVNEKITGELYTVGEPYPAERIRSTVLAMSVDPVAYSLLALDKLRGKASGDLEKHKSLFTACYTVPARELVCRILDGRVSVTDALICSAAGITEEELATAREVRRSLDAPQDMMSRMKEMQSGMRAARREYTGDEKELARTITEIERAILNAERYREALERSPEAELASLLNAMDGGYTAPSPGGDPVADPAALPTGRNLYAINAEATPGEVAWERGRQLAENTIAMYRERHNDSIPRKVSYTLWSGEFVETGGATIAQVLYMLGVEPVRDVFGRVNDIRLIPSDRLGRPRIDVVVQTSGQLRDIAASRLFLISRAVGMAAAAEGDIYENYVAKGVVDAEKVLVDKGLSPKEAREVSLYRVFGGVNGGYGTGITGMVQSGDRWDDSSEIAEVYLQNMGAYYGSEKAWEQVSRYALEAALANTDAVIQPRQSNTWGALSLDHVYEFMGGLNLAVRNVTGKEPDAYLSDYRNRNNMRMQELKEAIGVESRTTIFNPEYISEKMKGGAGAADSFAEIVRNTYGWNVMKPEAVDEQMWDNIFDVYVRDSFGLGIQGYFEKQNPSALQEITAVMMETARKGMWNASAEQLEAVAQLHTDLVDRYAPSCSGTVCNNAALREFIASSITPEEAVRYENSIKDIREASLSADSGVVLKRDNPDRADQVTTLVSNTLVAVMVAVAIGIFAWMVRRRRRKLEEQ